MSLETLVSAYGYPAVAAGVALEGETVLIMAAFLAHRGYLELPWVLLSGFLATLAVDQLFYFLGRRKGKPFLEARPGWAAKTDRVRRLLERRGSALAVGFRFLYGLRTVTPFVIGMSGLSPGRFLLLNAAGGLLWVLCFGLLGYAFGQALENLLGDLRRHEATVLVGLAAAGALFWLVVGRRGRRRPPSPPG